MKKVIDISLGGVKFSLEEDAYAKLKEYFKLFESTISDADEKKEIMGDIELRVAEIFYKEQIFQDQVIDASKIKIVIQHLGEIENPTADNRGHENTAYTTGGGYTKGPKRLYRSTNDKMLTGVCGGLGAFFNIDSTIIRIIMLILLIIFGTGLLAYLIVWIATPKAETVAQKLELQGYAPTAENIRKYTENNK